MNSHSDGSREERYLHGARSAGYTTAHDEVMRGTPPSDSEGRARKGHSYGMGHTPAVLGSGGYKTLSGPPLVSEDEFRGAVEGGYEKGIASLTPEVVEAKKREHASYMGAQAADDYGQYRRAMATHKKQYG